MRLRKNARFSEEVERGVGEEEEDVETREDISEEDDEEGIEAGCSGTNWVHFCMFEFVVPFCTSTAFILALLAVSDADVEEEEEEEDGEGTKGRSYMCTNVNPDMMKKRETHDRYSRPKTGNEG